MNKITKTDKTDKNNKPIYLVTLDDETTFEVGTWFEKKTEKYHLHLPKDNKTGREYIREDKVLDEITKNGFFSFENKTTESRTLSSWRSRLDKNELKELEEAEKTIERLKKIGLERKPTTEVEKVKNERDEITKQRDDLVKQLGYESYEDYIEKTQKTEKTETTETTEKTEKTKKK